RSAEVEAEGEVEPDWDMGGAGTTRSLREPWRSTQKKQSTTVELCKSPDARLEVTPNRQIGPALTLPNLPLHRRLPPAANALLPTGRASGGSGEWRHTTPLKAVEGRSFRATGLYAGPGIVPGTPERYPSAQVGAWRARMLPETGEAGWQQAVHDNGWL